MSYDIPEEQVIANRTMRNCPDCGVCPGQVHQDGCDVERCSVCGQQRLGCECVEHDKVFSRWTGIWPGFAEAQYLGLDLNTFDYKYSRFFFIKPADGKTVIAGKQYLTPVQAAEVLKVTVMSIHRFVKSGQLAAVRPSPRVTLIAPEAIEEFQKLPRDNNRGPKPKRMKGE
jgi:excisionase family DNA binding protein